MAAERNGQYHISSCEDSLGKDYTHLESKHDLSIPCHNCSGWEKCTGHSDRLVSRQLYSSAWIENKHLNLHGYVNKLFLV